MITQDSAPPISDIADSPVFISVHQALFAP